MNPHPHPSPPSPRSVIVTGAASGIGLATAKRLAASGDSVTLVDLREDTLQEAVDAVVDIAGADRAHGVTADVSREEDMVRVASTVLTRWARIDALVHAAGILRLPGGVPRMLPDISTEECDRVIDTNLTGTFLANRAVLPAMIKQKSGTIINIASTSGKIGRALDTVYCASKFGVVGFSESLAEEVRSSGVRVIAMLPDAVDTPFWDRNGPIAAPEDAMPPERVAEVVQLTLDLPANTVLQNLVLMPYRGRKRRRKRKPDQTEPTQEGSTEP